MMEASPLPHLVRGDVVAETAMPLLCADAFKGKIGPE